MRSMAESNKVEFTDEASFTLRPSKNYIRVGDVKAPVAKSGIWFRIIVCVGFILIMCTQYFGTYQWDTESRLIHQYTEVAHNNV